MNKSTKIISSLAALGALCVGTAAMASPWHNGNCPGAGVPEAQCPIAADGPRADGPRFNKPSRQVDPAVRAARWDAIARMLTIKPEQEAAWKAYTLKTVESTLSQIRRRRARGTSGLWPSSP